MKDSSATVLAIPRIALLIGDSKILAELEAVLRDQYSSFLLITERKKLLDFDTPFVVIADSLREVQLVLQLPPPKGTQILVITAKDPESESAAYAVGAEGVIRYPFEANDVISITEKFLTPFRDAERIPDI